jgi:isopenicillin-N epimerase
MPNLEFAQHWLLDPAVTFLNHGSFGACPRPVLELQTELRERLEREPILFLDAELEGRLDAARQPLAQFIGAVPEDVAFVPNATTGVNTVLRSLDLGPADDILTTDHEYNACLNTARAIAAETGATLTIAEVPFPVTSAAEIVEAVLASVTHRTRIALFSHVTSATAVIFPVAAIASALADRGIETLIDGAHAPGMVPVDLTALESAGIRYYTGNCHKWLCAPKGAGFLWVRRDRQAGIRPLIVSHAANSPRRDRSYFLQSADWTGTLDPTPYLCVPAAIEFLAGLLPGAWPELMATNHRLAVAARDALTRSLETAPLTPTDMLGSMAAIELPADIEPEPPAQAADAPADATYPVDRLHDLLFERDSIEAPVYLWPPMPQAKRPTLRLLRVSAQVYNALPDYERLARALNNLVGARAGGA